MIKGCFPQGFNYDIINGNPMIHRRNLEVVIQAFMSRLVLELPPEAAFIDDTPAEESDIIEEEEDSVQVVKVPEHPSQEDKLDAILRIVLQLQASVDQIDAKLQHRKFSQRYLTEEMEVSR